MTFYTLSNYFRKLLLYFLFTIPYKVVFKGSAYFLGTSNLRNNSLLVRAISIACKIPKRVIVSSLILIGVVVGRRLREKDCCESFYKTGEVINEGFTY